MGRHAERRPRHALQAIAGGDPATRPVRALDTDRRVERAPSRAAITGVDRCFFGHRLLRFDAGHAHRGHGDDDLATLEAGHASLARLYRQVQEVAAARVAVAARAAVAPFRSWLDAEGWCEIEVDANLHIRGATRRGLALLGAAVPAMRLRLGAGLPTPIACWLRRASPGAPAGAARALAQGRRRFALRALPAVDDDGWLLYVRERAPAGRAPAAAPPAEASLTPREREVLAWVAAGKTDAQAAAILGISVRTVQKHLEHVYVKLGVEGRTAAVMRAHAAPRRTGG